ncbi:MAG: 1,4-alpha-glucan branching protein GlgB [Firmicutes bacterium]|nr:1,4-alpha-glucan branching protein GlgB [Bacillota bacterium]
MEFNGEKRERFYRGELYDAYRYFGCVYKRGDKSAGFRVWAPRAASVSVVGDFNKWNADANPLKNDGGIWECTVKGVKEFDGYKYRIVTHDGRVLFKSDPYALHTETRDGTNSKVYDSTQFTWTDADWRKKNTAPYAQPVNIYEAHIGSWRKYIDGNFFSYRLFAEEIAAYLTEMGYTHIELIGVAEYPFDASWGYQVTGYYAPTSRYGLPEDFAYLINKLHEHGIGVILDWVPGHFPKDENGLYEFDGGPLYEPEDELKREHYEWGTRCFDYTRGEVVSFLISNALYWLDVFHADGLRVDAVASMLYLDYNRSEYRPNRYGGKESIEAIDFLQKLNTEVFARFPQTMMIAEESTAWPLVTKPVDAGGLGFNFKWNMGWMNDSLSYAATDPYFRSGAHDKLTFSMTYAFSENYVLAVSHDEVVHGKGSLINKMPGDYAQQFAGWRNYLMYMFSHPGKKLTMMGTEFAQFSEWDYARELDWLLLDYPAHADAKQFFRTLSSLYKATPALWQIEDGWDGFAWRVVDDHMQNVVVYERADLAGNRMLCVLNFANAEWKGYTFGAAAGSYETVLYSDVSGWNTQKKTYKTKNIQSHGMSDSITLDIAPLSGIYMILASDKPEKKSALKVDKKADKKAVQSVQEKSAAKPKTALPKKPATKKPIAKPKTEAAKKAAAKKTTAKKSASTKNSAAKKPAVSSAAKKSAAKKK